MSYTPPAGDAAHFSWVGVSAYTSPAGDAADFSWYTAPPPAGGIKAFNGTTWVTAMAKRWSGSAWAAAFVRCWDGAAWVPPLLDGVISETGDSIVSESGDRLVLE
jgi:hypothetical protein